MIVFSTYVIIIEKERMRYLKISNKKECILLFAYCCVLVILLIGSQSLLYSLKLRAQTSYNMMPVMVYMTVYPLFCGILFALPYLVFELRKRGSWKFHYMRFIAVLIPSVYLILSSIVSFYMPYLIGYLYPSLFIKMSPTHITAIGGIVLGYTIILSFYKDAQESK